jgi:23S rRNA pseudouridine1911/1915/1917 synthase
MAMGTNDLEILYEDNHLLAVNKPAGLPTMGVAAGEVSLFLLVQQYIKRRMNKPGNVYLGIMSRLDAASSGVVLLARTSKAAARLTDQFRTRSVEKTYWAIVTGAVQPAAGEMVDWLRKNEAKGRMEIVAADQPGAKEARLSYRRVRRVDEGSLVEIDLHSGRKHQIRVQFAARGWPVWGEPKYGHATPFGAGIALHARRLVVEHPVRKQRVELIAPLPQAWLELGIDE